MAVKPTINDLLYTAKKASGPDNTHKSVNDLIYAANGGGVKKSINDVLRAKGSTPTNGSVNDRLYYKLKSSGPDGSHKSLADLIYANGGVV